MWNSCCKGSSDSWINPITRDIVTLSISPAGEYLTLYATWRNKSKILNLYLSLQFQFYENAIKQKEHWSKKMQICHMLRDFIALSFANLTASTTFAQIDEFRSTGWRFFPAVIWNSVWVPSTDCRTTEAISTETTFRKGQKYVIYCASICD